MRVGSSAEWARLMRPIPSVRANINKFANTVIVSRANMAESTRQVSITCPILLQNSRYTPEGCLRKVTDQPPTWRVWRRNLPSGSQPLEWLGMLEASALFEFLIRTTPSVCNDLEGLGTKPSKWLTVLGMVGHTGSIRAI